MLLGLKNTGETYMRALKTMFYDMMHREIDVYVDDIIIKSKKTVKSCGRLKEIL